MKELRETLLKVVEGDNLDGVSIINLKFNERFYNLGIISKTTKEGFVTFKPSLKDKSFIQFGNKGFLKHVTLTDLEKWHITCEKPKLKNSPKMMRRKNYPINDNVKFWFGMDIKNLENLYEIKTDKDKKFRFDMIFNNIPNGDSNRRHKNLAKVIKGIGQTSIEIKNVYKNKECFYHFEFFICDKNINMRDLGVCLPVIDEGVEIPCNVLKFKEFDFKDKDIIISSMQVSGKIDESVKFWWKE